MTTTEPRALTAALQAPAFVTRGASLAMHVANRHVERWAPEEGAGRLRPLRNLGFVDRLVSPWLETAQRSASLRMFSQSISTGIGERAAPSNVSWVFPRPWFQDELDWMAAARQVGTQSAMQQAPAPTMLTTRGTYVPRTAMPAELYEYVAPSLSVARPDVQSIGDAYSPLVPFAATQAAHVMARAVAPLSGAARMSPGLRAVLTTMLERATRVSDVAPTRASMTAPELVTPPAPRPVEDAPALEVAERYAEQHAQIADLQRTARVAVEREVAARAAATPSAAPTTDAQLAEIRAAQARAIEQRQAELARRTSEAPSTRRDDSPERAAAAAAERQRIEERIAQRIAATRRDEATRLHEQSRDAAARDARHAPTTPVQEPAPRAESRVALEIAAAVAALPPELASLVTAGIGQRPERAVQTIAELGEALRSVELIARNTAAGGTFEATRGPRVVMPAGLGGLVSTVDRTAGHGPQPRMPALPFIQAPRATAPASGLGATTAMLPAALAHVAWSDRWLARFAGARPQSLAVLAAASPESRMQILAQAAPDAVFIAPMFEQARASEPLPTLRGGPAPAQDVRRFDDNEATPDDVLSAIAISASRTRATAAMAALPPKASLPAVDPDRYQPRDTLADVVAHAAPAAPGAGLSAQLASSPFAAALHHVLPLGTAPSFDVRSLFGAGLSATYLAGLVGASTDELAVEPAPTRSALEFEPTYVAPERDEVIAEQAQSYAAPLTTLRSALLAWDVETVGTADMRASQPSVSATASSPLARTMIESLALPMLGDSPDVAPTTTSAAPGMLAERMQAWSVAQERSSSDLAFDFVTPELVLAARVYGLGPAEAAQAARLAVAGPAQLSAMAGAVDRTFVQAMAIEAERRGERRVVSAYPLAAGDTTPSLAQLAHPVEAAAPTAGFTPSTSAFGIERRAPRGAFLWPAATTAALGLTAPAPDGDQSISVAALELLAAQAVAELGTYTALSDVERTAIGEAPARSTAATPAEAHDEDVLDSASALVPTARREKFQALYVALSQSPSGRTWSPAARAARALALAGRGEDTVSARERATIAWDVLPVVYGADAEEAVSTGEAAARAVRRREELRALDPVFVDARPGLSALSARAGEALGSYVSAPASAPASSSSSSSREVGAVHRAPTAAPEFVQTGRGGRVGGGEVEIPAWFEQAARKMFESKSNLSDGISLAELTLVSSAPAAQVAASGRGAASAAPVPAAVSPSAAAGAEKEQIDIEKVASDVYREVLVLMDLARARNGEPYL